MTSTKKYEWLLFDLDNTILDFSAGSKHAFAGLLAELKIKQEGHYYSLYQSINTHIWFELNTNKITQDEVRYRRFHWFFQLIGIEFDAALANQIYFKHLGESAVFIDGALEMLHRLKDNYHLCVVTNGMKEVQISRLEKSGLNQIFEATIISDQIGVAKPNAGFFDITLDTIGYRELDHILMIGDTPQSDIKGARDYGMDSCWYNPNKREIIEDIVPTYNVDSLRALEEEVLANHPD